MDPVVHFELPADDRDRMADFYTAAFGWKTHKFGEEMGNYITVSTTETDEQGMVQKPGAINGGLFPKPAEGGPYFPSLVIAVEDIHASAGKVAEAGGKILGEPAMIPGVGLYLSFLDTEGNRLSILQPVMP